MAVDAIAAQFSREGAADQEPAEAGSEHGARRSFAFIGMGDRRPGGGDIGRRHGEILREDFANKTA